MNHLVVFVFVLIIPSVYGQETLQSCIIVGSTLSQFNPGSSCVYTEDAVRCAINNLGLAKDNATNQEIQMGRAMTNGLLGVHNCSVTFDDIFSTVKAKPALLELQECIDTAMEQNLQDPEFFMTCDPIERSIRCGIGSLKLHEDGASDEVVKSFRSFANNQLNDLNCDDTFDDLLKEVKANPTMLVQECDDDGDDTTEEERFQQQNISQSCEETERSVRCGIKTYELYEDVPPNDYLMAYRATLDMDLSTHKCNTTFDDILNEVKANPELLEDLPGCQGRSDDVTTCDRIEEGVKCGIRALKLHEDTASDDDLMYGKQFASRYLSPYRCKKTFDVLLKEERKDNTGSTLSSLSWSTSVMAAFIIVVTAVY